MLSIPLEITYFLLFVDTLAKVIDENPVKAFNVSALACVCGPSAVCGAPLGTAKIG